MKINKYPKKVSIIMNCFNSERYISQAIKSVLSQRYQNWELIIWDNLSTDRSSKIIKSFKDKRIRYFLATHHTNLHEARNLALSKITGEFLNFLDCDDYWHNKFRLNLLVEKISENENLACVYSKFLIKYDHILLPKRTAPKKNLYSGKIFKDLVREYNFAIGGSIFRVSKLEKFPKIFNEKYDYISDFDFAFRLSKHGQFDKIDLPLFTYRKRKNSMSDLGLEKQVHQMEAWSLEMFKKNFFNSGEYALINQHIEHLRIKSDIKSKNFFEFFKYIFFNKSKLPFYKLIFYYIFKFN